MSRGTFVTNKGELLQVMGVLCYPKLGNLKESGERQIRETWCLEGFFKPSLNRVVLIVSKEVAMKYGDVKILVG